jgi:hypothetical protein
VPLVAAPRVLLRRHAYWSGSFPHSRTLLREILGQVLFFVVVVVEHINLNNVSACVVILFSCLRMLCPSAARDTASVFSQDNALSTVLERWSQQLRPKRNSSVYGRRMKSNTYQLLWCNIDGIKMMLVNACTACYSFLAESMTSGRLALAPASLVQKSGGSCASDSGDICLAGAVGRYGQEQRKCQEPTLCLSIAVRCSHILQLHSHNEEPFTSEGAFDC